VIDMRRTLRSALVTTLVGAAVVVVAPAPANAATIQATLVATRLTSTWARPAPDPSGIVFIGNGRFVISDSEVDEMRLYAGTNLFVASLTGAQQLNRSGTSLVWGSDEPTGVGYRTSDQRLFVSDDNDDRIYQVLHGPDGRYGTADDAVSSFSTRPLIGSSASDPEDVSIDMEVSPTGELLIADGFNKEVFLIGPGPNGVFEGTGDDTIRRFDIERYGSVEPEGIAYHKGRNTILVVDGQTKRIYELSRTGALRNVILFPPTNPAVRRPSGVAVAPPSGGGSGLNVYVTDRGLDNDNNPTENDGRFYELRLP
jgi:hypothetical protein